MEGTKQQPLMTLKRTTEGGTANGNCCNDNNSKLPESPRLPMEFLSRSWSLPALQLSRALSSHPGVPTPKNNTSGLISPNILEEETATHFAVEEDQNSRSQFCHDLVFQDQNSSYTNSSSSCSSNSIKQNIINQYLAGNSFSFACNATSQLILERIMSQSDVSPLASGRPSCSEPLSLSGGGQSCNSFSGDQLPLESPTYSPPHHNEFDHKFLGTNGTPHLQVPINRIVPKNGTTTPVGGGGGGKTVGRWLKDRKEKKKEEMRANNAQLHAAVSVAAVAAAVAAAAAATASASSSGNGKDEQAALTDAAMASAATLVAARCVEAAESLGADHDHLASVIGSAVNVQSHGDIMTLTAAAATALRGAATLKARAMKEVCNIAAVLPVAVERSLGDNKEGKNNGYGSKPVQGDDVVDMFSEEFLARGAELLKRTRNGEFHWKIVSVYINKAGQVILKMKSKLAAGTFTKKKKKVLMDVCKNMPAWPERCRVDYGEERCYFGFKTVTHRIIQFECKNKKEHDAWTHGVSRVLSLAADQNRLNLRNYSFGSR